ncbi:MAG: aldehyde dehydrogenase family protein [Deltaproteobacteria bacterium]|nr:aldehyde dehydrogenase family protein [Deltaproteobacteria bacterium]
MGERPYRMFIDGAWIGAGERPTYPIPNPATEEIVAHAPEGTRGDVGRAIAAARRAFDHGPWPRSTPAERAAVLLKIADGIQARKEQFRALLVAAHAAEAMTHVLQLETPIYSLYNHAELVGSFPWEEEVPTLMVPTKRGMMETHAAVVRQPAGVCALIPTWNFPLFTTLNKIAPAIAAGCTMVVKPSPWGPLVDLLLAEVIAECDLPPGVFNVVTGQAPELGADLVESAAVDKVSFTGSVSTGKKIMRAAAETLKRVHLELGGKSALVILDDADVETAAPSAASPAFFHAGQGCALMTRVLVPRKKHDALVAATVAFIEKKVKLGDPADPTVNLGPVIREERRAAIETLIASGREQGAVLATGGGRPASQPRGYFVEPTVFANVRNHMTIAREEIFGPVVSILPFDDDDDAVRIANASEMGLYGGIVTNDVERGKRVARRIRTGGVGINNATNLLHAPFGGFKQSGIGREGGVYGVHEFTELQTIAWNVSGS